MGYLSGNNVLSHSSREFDGKKYTNKKMSRRAI